MAVINRQQHELLDEERARMEGGGRRQAPAAQEARGMRDGSSGVSRGGLGVPQQRPAPSRPAGRPGVHKGTAMDALTIFGALAGGS